MKRVGHRWQHVSHDARFRVKVEKTHLAEVRNPSASSSQRLTRFRRLTHAERATDVIATTIKFAVVITSAPFAPNYLDTLYAPSRNVTLHIFYETCNV